MKRIIYTDSEGLHIVHPAPRERVAILKPDVISWTEDQYLDWIKTKDVPADAVNIKIVDEDYIPSTRENRNDWIDSGSKVEPDQVKIKAREDAIAQAQANTDSILSKLNMSKEEFKILSDNLS